MAFTPLAGGNTSGSAPRPLIRESLAAYPARRAYLTPFLPALARLLAIALARVASKERAGACGAPEQNQALTRRRRSLLRSKSVARRRPPARSLLLRESVHSRYPRRRAAPATLPVNGANSPKASYTFAEHGQALRSKARRAKRYPFVNGACSAKVSTPRARKSARTPVGPRLCSAK